MPASNDPVGEIVIALLMIVILVGAFVAAGELHMLTDGIRLFFELFF